MIGSGESTIIDSEVRKQRQRMAAIMSELKEIEHAVKLGSGDASLPLKHARLLRMYDVLIESKDWLLRLSGDGSWPYNTSTSSE